MPILAQHTIGLDELVMIYPTGEFERGLDFLKFTLIELPEECQIV